MSIVIVACITLSVSFLGTLAKYHVWKITGKEVSIVRAMYIIYLGVLIGVYLYFTRDKEEDKECQ